MAVTPDKYWLYVSLLSLICKKKEEVIGNYWEN
jgi:hypothetical protein